MISIRAINRQPGWLGVEEPWNGAALLASHLLVGRGLMSKGSLIPLSPPPSSPELHVNMVETQKPAGWPLCLLASSGDCLFSPSSAAHPPLTGLLPRA